MKHIRKFNESENITDSDMINLKKYKDELLKELEDMVFDPKSKKLSFKTSPSGQSLPDSYYKLSNLIDKLTPNTSDDQSSSEFDHNLSNLKKGTNSLGSTYYYKDSEKDGYIDVAQRDRLGRVTGYMTVKSGTGIYESNVNESFKTKAQKLIDDTKKLKDDYPEKQYNKIIELEKLIDGTDEDKKKFVKSIMRLLGMTKSDLPDDLYRYL
jgi:hypothetical protein